MTRLPILSMELYIPLEVQETIKKYICIDKHMYYKHWQDKAIQRFGYNAGYIIVFNEGTTALKFLSQAGALKYTHDKNIQEFYMTIIGNENPEYIWVN